MGEGNQDLSVFAFHLQNVCPPAVKNVGHSAQRFTVRRYHNAAFELKRIEEAIFRGGKFLFGYAKFDADPAFHLFNRFNSAKL